MTPLFVYHERGEDDTQIELYIIYGTRFSGVYHKWGGESPEGNSPKEILPKEILPKEILPKEILWREIIQDHSR